MSPRIANKDKGELPKPVVKANALGVYGLSDFSLGLLAEGAIDCVLGTRNEPETLTLKEKPTLHTGGSKKADPIDVKGRFFNGLSDSFYRGHLPHVILVGTEPAQLEHFFEEFLDHVDKLFSLGFFLQKLAPVEELIPCTVLCTHGLYWENFMRRLEKSLSQMEAVDEPIKKQILLKFCRGSLEKDGGFAYHGSQNVPTQKPCKLRLAGGSNTNRMMAQSVLGTHGFLASVETSTDAPAVRLELLCAAKRLTEGVLPTLVKAGALDSTAVSAVQQQILVTVYKVGVERQAIEELETPEGLVALAPDCTGQGLILSGDRALLSALHLYAAHYQLAEAEAALAQLLSCTRSHTETLAD